MCTSFLIPTFLVLFGLFSIQVTAQTRTKTQPLPILKKENTTTPAPSFTEPKAEAKLLLAEGMKQTEAGQHPQAAESFQHALRLDPEYADAYAALGRAYFRMRQWQKAIDNLRRATALHAKEREANDALKQKFANEKREVPVVRLNLNPDSRPETKSLQATNISSGPKRLPSAAIQTDQPEPRRETITPKKTVSAHAETKPIQADNMAGVKTLPSAPVATAVSDVPKEKELTKPGSASSETNPPQATNIHRVKSLPPLSLPSASPELAKETNAPAKTVSTGAEAEPSQPINAHAAEVKALNSKLETKKEGEETSRTLRAADIIPETKLRAASLAAAAGVSRRSPESQPTEQSETPNTLTQAHESDVADVSMTVSTLENKNVTSIASDPLSAEASATEVYRVGPNDVLDIQLNDSKSPLSTLFTVTPAGLLEHPILPEALLVNGFTADEIGTKIESELNKLGLMQNPKVIVGVRDYASHAILISGLVKDPGTRFLRREAIPLYVAVADAQPLPQAASVTVMRNEQKRLYEIDLAQAADMNFLVRAGDVITLTPGVTQFFYIGGEVKTPGEKMYRRGLTLTQAILAAGGASPKSRTAEIGRDDSRGFLVATRFDLQDIQSGKAVDPVLRAGDRIIILR